MRMLCESETGIVEVYKGAGGRLEDRGGQQSWTGTEVGDFFSRRHLVWSKGVGLKVGAAVVRGIYRTFLCFVTLR